MLFWMFLFCFVLSWCTLICQRHRFHSWYFSAAKVKGGRWKKYPVRKIVNWNVLFWGLKWPRRSLILGYEVSLNLSSIKWFTKTETFWKLRFPCRRNCICSFLGQIESGSIYLKRADSNWIKKLHSIQALHHLG